MNASIRHGALLASTVVGLRWASLALRDSWGAQLGYRASVNLGLAVAALLWIGLLAASSLAVFLERPELLTYVTHVGFQALIIGVSFFLLACAGLAGFPVCLALGAQALAGFAVLHTDPWSDASQTAWFVINLWSASLLALAVACQALATRHDACWLALTGCFFGLVIGIDGSLSSEAPLNAVRLSHHFYTVFLLLTWHLVTQTETPGEALPALETDFPRMTTGLNGLHDAQQMPEPAALAVAVERRRIAQELHDGVGAQIVNILSSLSEDAPHQKAVAQALEQCLLELKMTVDAIDTPNDTLPDTLGRLRYRMQHALDSLGIRMVWKVSLCKQLEDVRGMQAQHVYRIAQESLTNVIRHANASTVRVVCCWTPKNNCLLMEVWDNGRGMAGGKAVEAGGKGLAGMRWRAQAIGGALLVSSREGAGTRVRLTWPVMNTASVRPFGWHGRFGGLMHKLLKRQFAEGS